MSPKGFVVAVRACVRLVLITRAAAGLIYALESFEQGLAIQISVCVWTNVCFSSDSERRLLVDCFRWVVNAFGFVSRVASPALKFNDTRDRANKEPPYYYVFKPVAAAQPRAGAGPGREPS